MKNYKTPKVKLIIIIIITFINLASFKKFPSWTKPDWIDRHTQTHTHRINNNNDNNHNNNWILPERLKSCGTWRWLWYPLSESFVSVSLLRLKIISTHRVIKERDLYFYKEMCYGLFIPSSCYTTSLHGNKKQTCKSLLYDWSSLANCDRYNQYTVTKSNKFNALHEASEMPTEKTLLPHT